LLVKGLAAPSPTKLCFENKKSAKMLKQAWTFSSKEGLAAPSPTKLRFENKKYKLKYSSKLGHFSLYFYLFVTSEGSHTV
jgi:hypothetical protein